MSRLQEQYKSEIQKNLYSKLNCNNIHEVPKISKIVLNIGLGEAKDDTKIIDKAQEELSLIAGQKAVKTKAKKAIAGFKIREGMPLGVSVTLRNKIMYEFLDRLINIAIPRIRDFRGLKHNSFDGNGNVIDATDFISGWLNDETVFGRPAAPFVLSDGSMLLSDDKANVIYRITYKN